MAETGEAKYLFKCIACQQEFKLPSMMSPIPEHVRQDEKDKPGASPCPGSGIRGTLIGPASG